jgi:hypothetical protein
MPGRQASFQWKSDTLTKNMKNFPRNLDRAIVAAVEYTATHGEATMRRDASWTDRTGNARMGLHTSTEHSAKSHRIIFAHSVPYGIWLEVRWSGRYAVILPTVRSEGERLMRLLSKLLNGLSSGNSGGAP